MTTPSSPVLLTQEELEERGAYWQNVLRLTHWTIEFRAVPQEELWREQEGAAGHVNWNDQQLFAKIRIVDQLHDPWMPVNFDHTIVHELLHLHLIGMSTAWKPLERYVPQMVGEQCYEAANQAEEVAVNALARAIISLHRPPQKTQEAPTS